MTPEVFVDFSICLQFLPNGNAPAWNPDCARFYFAALADIPDADAAPLMKSVATEFTFRPTPHDILALWRKAKAINAPQADALIADIYRLRDKYGEYAVSSPDFPGLRLAGEPQWSDPVKQRIVGAMGGWVAFCRDDAPASVQRGQLLKIAGMVIGGEGDGAIERLRLEYRETLAALPRPEADTTPAMSQPGSAPDDLSLARITMPRLSEMTANGKH